MKVLGIVVGGCCDCCILSYSLDGNRACAFECPNPTNEYMWPYLGWIVRSTIFFQMEAVKVNCSSVLQASLRH